LKDPSRKRDDFNDLLTGLNIATILHDLTRQFAVNFFTNLLSGIGELGNKCLSKSQIP